MKINIKRLTFSETRGYILGLGLDEYRYRQILKWIYQKDLSDISEMTDISKRDRGVLESFFIISRMDSIKRQRSYDGVEKFLFRLEDNNLIESVLIPDKDRRTLCLSTQVGCGLGCKFCLTGKSGLKRNLYPFEIIEQILSVQRTIKIDGGMPITNIVMMGMGEPLANFDNIVEAIKRITDSIGLGISPRRITLSTAGLIPQMLRLGEKLKEINIAVSLNAATDDTRDYLMPINMRYPLSALIDTCRRYPLPRRKRITFEYVMIKGINDRSDDALNLVRLVRGIRCKINLIPFNEFKGSDFKRPDEKDILRFQEILRDADITAFIRKSKGRDIRGACGQLSPSPI